MSAALPLRLTVMLALWLGLAGVGLAGPWPRGAGAGFVAGSLRWTEGAPTAHETHAEFGLRPRLTLVFALRHQGRSAEVDLGARWHPPDLGGGWAWGLGAGVRLTRGGGARALLTADAGRGFDLAGGTGWAQAGLRLAAGRGGAEAEVRAQAGLRRGRLVLMAGATHLRAPGAYRESRLRLGLGWRLTDRLTLMAEAAPGRARGQRTTIWQLGFWSDIPAAH